MSIWIDQQFIDRISYALDRFSWMKNKRLAVFRCPLCGDSQKTKHKRRAYFYIDTSENKMGDHYSFKCHNCGIHMSFKWFLKDFDSLTYKDYLTEEYKDQHTNTIRKESRSQPFIVNTTTNKLIRVETQTERLMTPIGELPSNHPCMQYVISRCIPQSKYNLLFHTDNFKQLALSMDPESDRIPEDSRLVIPFYDEMGNIKAMQGRSLDPSSKMRYITIKMASSIDKTYGVERVNRDKPVLVVEGPIDSLFLPNCLASADADLLKAKGDIYIWDNQPRNKEIVNRMMRAAQSNVLMVIWNDCPFNGKDINDMVKNGASIKEIMKYMVDHTFRGLSAQLELKRWAKI